MTQATTHDGWVETTLGEVAEINPRESLLKNSIAKSIPMANLGSFEKKIRKFEKKEFKGGCKFRNGDTLLARISPCLENGKTSYVDILEEGEIGFGSTEYIVIREKKRLSDKQFLYYLSISPEFRKIAIKFMTGTSGRQRVQTNLLVSKKLLLPPLPEQRAIAAILSSLDDKIELLREQNKTLEATAQVIFKEWFVGDNSNGKERVSDLISFNPREKIDYQKEYRFFDMKCLSENSMRMLSGTIRQAKSASSFRLNDTLMAKITPCLENGKTGFVFDLKKGEIARGSTEFIVMRAKELANPYFVYCLARDAHFRDYAIKSMTGTSGRQRVQVDILKNYQVKYSNNLMESFEKICKPMFSKIKNNSKQIQTLSKTRDVLLPKLMKGELRVRIF